MNLSRQFNSVIDQYLQPNGRLVLALSGGVDSRVLLDLIALYGKQHHVPVLAIHVHHGLSKHADEWSRHCQLACQALGVAFHLERVALELDGRSLEESAREARYSALSKHLHKGDLLLTGQHSDDQLETVILALKRGSGPKGLSAMAECMPFGQAHIVRPLLNVSRADIEAFAIERGFDWIEDESNQDTRFDRNFIRHDIAPRLRQRWPHISQSVHRTAQICAEQEALLDELLSDQLQKVMASDGSLLSGAMMEFSHPMRARLIRMWLATFQVRMPSREQIGLIWQQVAMAQQDANPIVKVSQGEVRRFANRLYFVSATADISAWKTALRLNEAIRLPDSLGELVVRECSNGLGHLSSAALASGELSVHFNPEGLSAHPSERGHSRKLKKLFQEYAVPSWQRRRMPIIMCGEQVVAIANLFVDRHFVGKECELIWDK